MFISIWKKLSPFEKWQQNPCTFTDLQMAKGSDQSVHQCSMTRIFAILWQKLWILIGKQIHYTFSGGKSVKLFLTPFGKGVYSKGKNLLPMGANSFLLEQIPFRRGLMCRKANRKSQKLHACKKWLKIYQKHQVSLKIWAQLFKTNDVLS